MLVVGVGVGVGFGGDTGSAPVVLLDNFNDNSRNTALWNLGALYNGVTANTGTVAEASTQLQVTPLASQAALSYGGYVTVSTWDQTNKAAFVKIANVAAFSADQEAYIVVGADSNNYYVIAVGGGNTIARKRIAGTDTNMVVTAYSATAHAWLRILHQSSDNTIHLAAAPSTASNPPISTDWTDLASGVLNGAITITSVLIALGSGTSGSDASPGMAQFDGFNTGT